MQHLALKYIDYDKNATSKERRLQEHTVAYNLLKDLLKEHFGLDNPAIFKTENGKPYVNEPNIYFSLSHTDSLAAVVVADTPVGIDCEKIKPKEKEEIKRFASRFFTKNEIDMLHSSDYSIIDFFKIWTGKEAVIKMRGSTSADIKKIDTTLENLFYSFENEHIICIKI